MKIRHLKVERFRGIKFLEWNITNNVICLIGPGDSTKSTILDAIEYTLFPNYYIPFTDIDFYNVDISNPIEITITVGELPEELMSEGKFGLFLKGWKKESGALLDEPDDRSEPVLSIKLTVDENLEPEWTIVKFKGRDEIPIGYKDRAKLGVVRLGHEVNQHLSWGRNSAISKLTEDQSGMKSILFKALRQAKEAVNDAVLGDLIAAAKKAKEAGAEFGIKPKAEDYKPVLDVQSVSIGTGAVSLHDNKIPLRLLGFGSKRLLALALQKQSIKEGAIILIDEIEHGLEPHRARQLCKTLKHKTTTGQVIMTSHSPSPILEFGAENVCVVRNIDGITEIKSINPDLQDITRKYASALLAKRIIVCEGKTEVGICKGFDKFWAEHYNNTFFAHLGVDPVDGGGTDNASKYALKLKELGYDVLLFIDTDRTCPDEAAIQAKGIKIIKWDNGLALEDQICKDLPWEGLKRILSFGVELLESGSEGILKQIKSKDPDFESQTELDIDKWQVSGLDKIKIRSIIGKTAKDCHWYKDIEPGEKLADILNDYLSTISETTLAKNFFTLKEWIYGNNA